MFLALNKKSAQKQKPRQLTTASRKPLFQESDRGLNKTKTTYTVASRSLVTVFFYLFNV
jgi:hypothetical protein